jgi:peptide/nickel transport system substrate-binding protein
VITGVRPGTLIWLLVSALIGVLVIGCGAQPDARSGGSTTVFVGGDVPRTVLQCPQGSGGEETPQYGGTLVILHEYSPTNLGAWWEPHRFVDVQLARFAVENLVGLDAEGRPVPQLATSWEVDDQARTITLHLRQGVKFHDGTDFDAEAVRWNLEMQSSGVKTELKAVASVEVIDRHTVRVKLSRDDPLFVQRLSSSMTGRITSPAAYELYGPDGVRMHPVGTGPFKLVRFERDELLEYERFEDYWQSGLPYLDGVVVKFVPGSFTRKLAFMGGEGHVLYGVLPADVPSLEAKGANIAYRTTTLFTLAGNSGDPESPTADIRVRRAITYALDVPTIVNGVHEGTSVPTNQLAVTNGPGWSADIKGYPYDPAKAAKLLAEVGITPATPWKTDLFYQVSEDRNALCTVIQEYLAKVGIEVDLVPLDSQAMAGKIDRGWQGLAAFSMSYNVGTTYSSMLQRYLSEDAYSGGPYLSIPADWNAAYREMLTESDMAKRSAAYQELNKMAIDDYCLLTPMYAMNGIIAMAPELRDSGFCVYCTIEFLPETAWLGVESGPATTSSR